MCIANRTGSSDTKGEESSRTTSGNRGSGRAGSLSLLQLGEPESRLSSLVAEFGERHDKCRRAGDQDHVISYSHSTKRRIRSEELHAGDLAEAASRAIAVDRPFDGPAHGYANPALLTVPGHSKCDQCPPRIHTGAADGCLEIRSSTDTERLLHRRRFATGSVAGALCDGGFAPLWLRPARPCGEESHAPGGGSASLVDRFA
jgi:hypothetical protein